MSPYEVKWSADRGYKACGIPSPMPPLWSMAQAVESLAESMQAMQLYPSAQAHRTPSDTASSSTRTHGTRPAPSPVAPPAAPQPQTGLDDQTPLRKEKGLVIISESENVYGPPARLECETKEPELDRKFIFHHIDINSYFNFIKCENCGGLWFRIKKEGMNRLWDLKMEREQIK